MFGSPQQVIDRVADFAALGISGFTPQIRPQEPETYQELDKEVFSAFDRSTLPPGAKRRDGARFKASRSGAEGRALRRSVRAGGRSRCRGRFRS